MALTQTQKEFYQLCDSHDFIPTEVLDNFTKRLKHENNQITIAVGLEKFFASACPNCNAAGAFKWHFLGKLKHPDCGWAWYVSPGEYTKRQLKAVFSTGMNLSADIYSDAEKKGEKGAGCVGAIFGFFIGLFFRLPFAIAASVIQAIVYGTQKQPEPKAVR